MTIQSQVTVQAQVLELIPRDYDVFGGLDVDHHSIMPCPSIDKGNVVAI